MTELEQLKKLIKGYQELINEIDSWGPQRKATQEHLDILKRYFRQMKDAGRMFEKFIIRIGPEEAETKFWRDRIQSEIIKLADNLRESRIGLKDWEALVKKDSVKSQ